MTHLLIDLLDDIQSRQGWGKPINAEHLLEHAAKAGIKDATKQLVEGHRLGLLVLRCGFVYPMPSRPIKK